MEFNSLNVSGVNRNLDSKSFEHLSRSDKDGRGVLEAETDWRLSGDGIKVREAG
jgi:hypothetical protein